MSKDTRRKIQFHLNPEVDATDDAVCDMLAEIPLGERGRAMRSLLVAGAALRQLDPRLPNMLAALLNSNTTNEQITACILTMLPHLKLEELGAAPVAETTPASPIKRNMNNLIGKK